MNQLSVNSSSITRVLGVVAILLVLASVAGQLSTFLLGHGNLYGFVPLFYVGNENNIPTYFSVLLMLIASLLLAIIAFLEHRQAGSYSLRWTTLSIGFFIMGYDEAFQIHEKFILPVRELLGDGSYNILYFAWVVPGIVLVLCLALYFQKFLFRLSAPTRFRFFMAAAIYLGGAIGIEMIGGRHVALHGHQNLTYVMITNLEEGLEMAGLVLFIWALLKYCSENYAEVQFQFKD